MTQKNPVPSPLLPSLADTPQKAQEIQNLWQFLYLIYETLGGGNDTVGDLEVEAYTRLDTGAAQGTKGFVYTHSISSDYTTIGDECIRATAACTITLNSEPNDRETVAVQPTGDFIVVVSGSINGESEIKLYKGYDSVSLEYYLEFDEWVIV